MEFEWLAGWVIIIVLLLIIIPLKLTTLNSLCPIYIKATNVWCGADFGEVFVEEGGFFEAGNGRRAGLSDR